MTKPNFVILPDGQELRRSDLPSIETVRWVKSRKTLIVLAVKYNLLTLQEACDLYHLSEEELHSWIQNFNKFGKDGLSIKKNVRYK